MKQRLIWACSLALTAFSLSAQPVIITEIMYKPVSLLPADEWIELHNPGTAPVNLNGWRLADGVYFTFTNVTIPAGGYYVVAADLSHFQTAYPGVNNVVGGWTDQLSNSGEAIDLVDANGQLVDRVRYANTGDWGTRRRGPILSGTRGWEWYAEHDGFGKSLELISVAMPNDFGQNWSASTAQGGTPGVSNSNTRTNIAPLILEVQHVPAVPKASDTVTINARILDEQQQGLLVMAFWKVANAAFTMVQMADDGSHNDGVAGDGIYGAFVPPQPNLSVVEFYVEAYDGNENTRTWPTMPLNESGNPVRDANALYQVDDTVYDGTMPYYRVTMTEAERLTLQNINTASDAQMNHTFITMDGSETLIRYNCGVRLRGAGSRGGSVKNYRVNIPNDRPWKGKTAINLNVRWPYAQLMGSLLGKHAGVLVADARPVQLRVNGVNLSPAGASPYASYASYLAVEPVNGDLPANHIPQDPDGNVYRASRYPWTANLDYQGTSPATYMALGYYKNSNISENDWSDLIQLTDVLNNSSDSGYVRAVSQVVNVDEWMAYFALCNFIDYRETSLARGVGDDYAMYRGMKDPRFLLIGHDFDTILGEGDTGGSTNRAIWEAVDNPATSSTDQRANFLPRFMRHPEFAPIYLRKLKHLTDVVFAPENFGPLVDRALEGWVPPDVGTRMKTFVLNRRDRVLAQLPLTYSISLSLPSGGGYYISTTANLALNGRANGLEARTVRINGAEVASWTPWNGQWNASVTLQPGINRIVVQGFNAEGVEVGSATENILYDNGSAVNVSGTLSGSNVWTAASGPYRVTSNLLIPAGSTLALQPGATVLFSGGARLNVSGRLVAEGTAQSPVYFTRAPDVMGTWAGIRFDNAAGEQRIAHAVIEYVGGNPCVSASGSDLFLDHIYWTNTTSQLLDLTQSSITLQHSVLPTISGNELVHFSGMPANGHAIFQSNIFGTTISYNDIIDLTGGNRPGPIAQFLDNIFTGAVDDVLDLDSTDAHIERNIFMNVHQDQVRPSASHAISTGQDTGDTAELTIARNIFFNCDHVLLLKQNASAVLQNNTVVYTRTNLGSSVAAAAVVSFGEPNRGVAGGAGARLEGNIFWDLDSNRLNLHYTNDVMYWTVDRSITPGTNHPGAGNLNRDPMFAAYNPTTLTYSNLRQALSLLPGSPAKGTGPNGLDMGAMVPAGASVSGVPTGVSSQSTVTLNIAGPGLTAYRYRFNNGDWSGEMDLATPLVLTGLSAGVATVDVIGKNSADAWQAVPTRVSWTVGAVSASVRLNEVLARNVSAVAVGQEYPDLIELYNEGAAAFNLVGMSLSDDPAQPKKFIFPAGAQVPAGGYLVLYADNEAGANHLGFGLNQNGDALYLYNSDGSLRDSVQFGIQLADASIGRDAKGAWTLNTPSFGAPNMATPVTDGRALVINEWLAIARAAHLGDFVELYNPLPVPANMGGMYLSDEVFGWPTRYQVPPLSFIAAQGYFAFVADGDTNQGPEHMSFKLSGDQGEIALYGPDNTLQDFVPYGPQTADISEGRRPDGGMTITQINPPTPGAANPASGAVITTTEVRMELLPMLSRWQYDRSDTDLGTGWRAPGYDDSGWSSGMALLGRETAALPYNLNTSFSGYNDTQVTYYFRTTFNVDTNLSGFAYTFRTVVDDGAIIYLNGTEIRRIRMPSGDVNHSTISTDSVGDATEETFTSSSLPIQQGLNTLAVEVHQRADPNSSDVVWGMSLHATYTITNITLVNIVMNEIMANNVSAASPGDTNVTDWIELYNPTSLEIDLSGMSLTDDLQQPKRWVFPAGVTIAARGYLTIRCDALTPASTNYLSVLNTGFGLSANGDSVYLMDRAGRPMDSLSFGLQAADWSIGRVPTGTGAWRLNIPTPGAGNVPTAVGSLSNLRFNEWMANPSGNNDDYFELHNPEGQPVDLSGLYLTDTLSQRQKHRIAPLSFIGIGENAFAHFIADNNASSGPNHAGFGLSAGGEALGLFTATGTRIDAVSFGAQANGVSEGRFPDGSATIVRFPGTPTPGTSNMRELTEVVINEVLSHTDPPLMDAIELHNVTAGAVDVSGWFLTDDRGLPRKFRIPDGTVIAPFGFVVFYESQFNPNPDAATSFALSSAKGEDLYLYSASQQGVLTGYRNSVEFGASLNAISFGRHITSIGVDFPPMLSRTFGRDNATTTNEFVQGTGLPNSQPLVGSVVISEIMYRQQDGTNELDDLEFVELYNPTVNPVTLQNGTNTWRLRDGVDFDFPPNVTLPPNGYLLVVGFDPATNGPALAAFRAHYGLSIGVTILGPFDGRLANGGENIELYRPDFPVETGNDAGYVPWVQVDKVKYSDEDPWPSAADNTNKVAISLQRRAGMSYGNDPVNWIAGIATPGAGSGAPIVALPSVNQQPESLQTQAGSSVSFTVAATGAAPLKFQWRFAGRDLPGATNTTLSLANVQIAQSGAYSVRIVNAAGATLSHQAVLSVLSPPVITRNPQSQSVGDGETATFTVAAEGSLPLWYQWYFNNQTMANETNTVLRVANVAPEEEGTYLVVITNAYGSVTSTPAALVISAIPTIITQPKGANVFVGTTLTLTVEAVGALPLSYQWRLGNVNIPGANTPSLTLTNLSLSQSGNYRVLITNSVGSVLSDDAVVVVSLPPVITISATDPSATEGAADSAVFTVSRTGSTTKPLAVHYSIGGTAVRGNDYAMPESPATIPAGAASTTIQVVPLNDAEREASETVVLTIVDSAEYAIGAQFTAAATLTDDDNLTPTVVITAPTNGTRYLGQTNVNIVAQATDPDGSIARVEFYANSTNKLGEAAGAPYSIVLTNLAPGNYSLTALAYDNVGGTALSSPVNILITAPGFADMFEDRGRLSGFTNYVVATNTSYTSEPGEPRHHHNGGGNGTRSAWMTWTAPVSGQATMDTLGSSFDTVIVVYTNRADPASVSNLVKHASNDDASDATLNSRVTFAAVAGTSYHVAVDAYAANTGGRIVFHMSLPNPNPVITQQPQSQTVNPGVTIQFQVVVASPGPCTYQWKLNDQDIAKGTNSVLVVANVQAEDQGTYMVVVRNASGFAVSAPAQLQLRGAPAITAGLTNLVVNPGGQATLSVTASGAGPLAYQWLFNGSVLEGETASSLVRNGLQHTNGGIYMVRVSNTGGTNISQAELIVRPSVMRVLITTNTTCSLTIAGTPGKAYIVQGSTNFTTWSDIGTAPQTAPQSQYDAGALTPGSPRFYRLKLAP